LESLLETITERITMFVMALIAPFVQPIIKAVSASLKTGNNAVIASSTKAQYEVWSDPHCSDPTHSMLSKDHFSNILNEPAGKVASEVLQYVAPRVVYGWEHPDVPIHEILNDVVRVFHHPALRDNNIEIQRRMFGAVENWVKTRQGGGGNLNQVLGSDSVKAGRNHEGSDDHSHGSYSSANKPNKPSKLHTTGAGSHSKVSGSPFEMFNRKREVGFDGEGGASGPSGYGGQQQQQHGGYNAGGYPPQQGYGQGGGYGQAPPNNDPYSYTVGTSYSSGQNDGYYQQARPGQHGGAPPSGSYQGHGHGQGQGPSYGQY
jgi:hypothetical protein